MDLNKIFETVTAKYQEKIKEMDDLSQSIKDLELMFKDCQYNWSLTIGTGRGAEDHWETVEYRDDENKLHYVR